MYLFCDFDMLVRGLYILIFLRVSCIIVWGYMFILVYKELRENILGFRMIFKKEV